MKTERFELRLNEQDKKAIQELADSLLISKSEIVRRAIQHELELSSQTKANEKGSRQLGQVGIE